MAARVLDNRPAAGRPGEWAGCGARRGRCRDLRAISSISYTLMPPMSRAGTSSSSSVTISSPARSSVAAICATRDAGQPELGGEAINAPAPAAGDVRAAHEVHQLQGQLLELHAREPQLLQPPGASRWGSARRTTVAHPASRISQPKYVHKQRRHHEGESGVHHGEARGVHDERGEQSCRPPANRTPTHQRPDERCAPPARGCWESSCRVR